MNYKSLIIQQAEHHTNHGPQSDLCSTFCEENISSFCTCSSPHHHHFPPQRICRAPYWKGHLLPQWALTGKIYHIYFLPFSSMPIRPPCTSRTKSETGYYPPKTPSSALCSVHHGPLKIIQRFKDRKPHNTPARGEGVYVPWGSHPGLRLPSTGSWSKLLNLWPESPVM